MIDNIVELYHQLINMDDRDSEEQAILDSISIYMEKDIPRKEDCVLPYGKSYSSLIDSFLDISSKIHFNQEDVIELSVIAFHLQGRSIHISPDGVCYIHRQGMLYPNVRNHEGSVPKESIGKGWRIIPYYLFSLPTDLLNYPTSKATICGVPTEHLEMYKRVSTIEKIYDK